MSSENIVFRRLEAFVEGDLVDGFNVSGERFVRLCIDVSVCRPRNRRLFDPGGRHDTGWTRLLVYSWNLDVSLVKEDIPHLQTTTRGVLVHGIRA